MIKEELNEMQTGVGEYEKVATMICTAELGQIEQGLDLAESLGFISDVEYEAPTPDGIEYAPPFRVEGRHTWKFPTPDADVLFLNELKRQYKKTSNHDFRIMFLFSQGIHGLTPHSCKISLFIK